RSTCTTVLSVHCRSRPGRGLDRRGASGAPTFGRRCAVHAVHGGTDLVGTGDAVLSVGCAQPGSGAAPPSPVNSRHGDSTVTRSSTGDSAPSKGPAQGRRARVFNSARSAPTGA